MGATNPQPSPQKAPPVAAAPPPPAPAVVDDKGATRYGRQELHVAGDVSSRYKKKRRTKSRPTSPGPEGRHAFEMPTAPVVREVGIGETVTVSELAQKMAVKANEVIKVLMNIGVMATINQPLDRDTAVLVVEEMGHTPKVLKENQIEEDLRNQYSIGYTPTPSGGGTGYRKIHLTAKRKDYVVQTRDGYYAR